MRVTTPYLKPANLTEIPVGQTFAHQNQYYIRVRLPPDLPTSALAAAANLETGQLFLTDHDLIVSRVYGSFRLSSQQSDD